MENWLLDIMAENGYGGIFVLIALENLFPPIPSEIILTFGGFLTTTSNLSVVGVICVATLGSVVGAILLYLFGALLGLERLERIIEKWGKYLRLKKEDIHKAEGWFQKYGPLAVFFCRFIPLIRSLISIPAGLAKMNFTLFLLLSTLGTLIWNIILVLLGASLGESWDTIVHYMDVYSNVVYAALFLLVLVAFTYLWKNRSSKKLK
ncbi:DedA family protein [Salirhabdus sp. Marseille-P4669]|uniref:DedA family protein n=1 Tax=Salirhabdus sp. Marseille-P4669 TaxID=2042310 RepID=UPI000C79C16C|nr:DedA family protein [Salirhabdus sp. Marseille-P4669]